MNTLLDEILTDLGYDELKFDDVYEILDDFEDDELDREGPSIASRCGGYPVRTALHIATSYSKLASKRLNYLSSLSANEQKNNMERRPGEDLVWNV